MDPVSQQPQRRRIAVAGRLRPASSCELEHEAIWTVDAAGRTLKEARSGDIWTFDHAFGPDVDNAGVFEACCADVISAFCGGVNGTIVTYGQTASGKTHTMHGPEGVVPRAVEEVFSIISACGGCRQFLLTASFVEIYNEQVFDLLAGGEVNTMEGQNGLVLQNLTHIAVSCPEDVLDAVALGEQRRRVGETSANRRSSRSHVLLRLGLESRMDGDSHVRYSQLNLGDLAGSEGLRHVELTSREQRREGSCINKSLLALSQVVQALAEGGSRGLRVGFRASKLTRILQPSLGGNAHTVMICTLSPGFASRAESRSTLDFAARARCVENSISVNIRKEGHQDSQIRALEKQLSVLRERVSSLQMTNGEVNANDAKELSEENATLRRKIERLEAAMLGGAHLSTVSPAAGAVASNLSGKRRRRTIACGAEKEHVGLSETTVRDFMLQLPEGQKLISTLNATDISCSFCSLEETPAAKLHPGLACPRQGVLTPVATPQRSALRQPGFLSHRPLARCSTPPRRSTPPKRVDLQPVAMCFSPISLLSVDAESPCRRCEFGSISQIVHDSSECLDDLQEEAQGQLLLIQDCRKILHGNDSEREAAPWKCELVEKEMQKLAQLSPLHDGVAEFRSCEGADSSRCLEALQSNKSEMDQLRLQATEHDVQCSTNACQSIEGLVRLVQRSSMWTVLEVALAHWRIALADSRALRARELQDEMRRRLERCACGERQIFEARVRDEAVHRLRRPSAIREEEADRSPALFPAGAGAFGTLLKTQHEGHVQCQ